MKEMIKRVVTVLLAVVFLAGITAVGSNKMTASEMPLRIVVDTEKVYFPDAQPFLDGNSRVQVPVRFVTEALGAEVKWDGETQKVTVTLGSKVIELTIGKKDYTLNGETKTMDTVAQLKNSRSFVPIRFVSEALGSEVKWEQNIKTVYIFTTGSKTVVEPTKTIGGFVVPTYPEYTDLATIDDDRGGMADVWFELMMQTDISDIESQLEDLERILLQKCDQSTVDEVISYIRTKKVWNYKLQYNDFYDKKSQRYVWVDTSNMYDINVFYGSESYGK